VIARRVIMPAFETLSRIAKEERSGRQQRFTVRTAIPESAVQHHGDADVVVLFFEVWIMRAVRADDVADPPAGT
jgi:translation initiation factor 2 beta subunit (eIF-2beta)/eIF-5